MQPQIDSVTSSETLPAEVDVVIIGGGIIGACTALFLAERRISVAVCEKGVVGAEQSGRNGGLCRQTRRAVVEMGMMMRSIEIWKDLNRRVGAETGFRQAGIMITCDDDRQMDALAVDVRTGKEFGLQLDVLNSEQATARIPGIARRLAGAVYNPSDGCAEPAHATPAIARAAAARGATIHAACAVRGLETTAGHVSAVVTEKGTIRCNSVVLAAGLWSRRFLTNLGLHLPMLQIHTWIQATAPIAGPPAFAIFGSDFYSRPRIDGGWNVGRLHLTAPIVPDSLRLFRKYLPMLKANAGAFHFSLGRQMMRELRYRSYWENNEATPFESDRVFEFPINERALASTKIKNDAVIPYFRGAKIAHKWSGAFDILPDELPVISEVTALKGLIVATGFSGHGFGIGPAAAEQVAKLVTGERSEFDLSPFRLDRFRDPSGHRKPGSGANQ